MSPIKFYNDMMSQPVRAVWIFMKINNIPFESVTVSVKKGETLKEDYIKLVPSHTVPAINDGGFILAECQAILMYLCRKYSHQVAPHWYPEDLKIRAKVDEYMSWQHTNLRWHGMEYFFKKFYDPNIDKKPVDESTIQEVTVNMERVLDFMEKHVIRAGTYIAGDDITLADLMAYCEITQLTAGECDVTGGRPKIDAWMKLVEQRLNPTLDEAHKVIYAICKRKSLE